MPSRDPTVRSQLPLQLDNFVHSLLDMGRCLVEYLHKAPVSASSYLQAPMMGSQVPGSEAGDYNNLVHMYMHIHMHLETYLRHV